VSSFFQLFPTFSQLSQRFRPNPSFEVFFKKPTMAPTAEAAKNAETGGRPTVILAGFTQGGIWWHHIVIRTSEDMVNMI
jgi:hypothetical protein